MFVLNGYKSKANKTGKGTFYRYYKIFMSTKI